MLLQKSPHYFSIIIVLLLLSGCSTYHPKPILVHPVYTQPTQLTVSAQSLPFPKSAKHTIHFKRGLDMTDISILAVIDNPALKVARDKVGVTKAQSFAAGLLPDPQFSTADLLPLNTGAGNSRGFDLALMYDIQSLLTYSTRRKAAAATQKQANLNLLWQEWQVISQAQALFTQIIAEQQQLNLLKPYQHLLQQASQQLQQALNEGNETLDQVAVQRLALQANIEKVNNIQQQLIQHQHSLNLLLNLPPETQLKLISTHPIKPIHRQQVKIALQHLVTRRPDLLALRAAYKAQDLKFREAIINQFPVVSVGVTRSRDTQDTQAAGFGITINIPLFNRNRGNVAIEKATRQQLFDDFQQRLNAAYNNVYRLLDLQQLLLKQYHQRMRHSTSLAALAHSAKRAYQRGDMTLLTYIGIQANTLDDQLNLIDLRQALQKQRIALHTLLGPWQKPHHPPFNKTNKKRTI